MCCTWHLVISCFHTRRANKMVPTHQQTYAHAAFDLPLFEHSLLLNVALCSDLLLLPQCTGNTPREMFLQRRSPVHGAIYMVGAPCRALISVLGDHYPGPVERPASKFICYTQEVVVHKSTMALVQATLLLYVGSRYSPAVCSDQSRYSSPLHHQGCEEQARIYGGQNPQERSSERHIYH